MLAREVGVKAARDVLRDKLGGRSLDCAANNVFKFGVEAVAKGARKDRNEDGFGRKVLDVAVVVVVDMEVIARRWPDRAKTKPLKSFWCEGPSRQCNNTGEGKGG